MFCRIKELFDIIVDFPDSELALTDLRECLNHVDMREELMESLTKVYVLIHYTSPSLSLPFSFLPPLVMRAGYYITVPIPPILLLNTSHQSVVSSCLIPLV